MVTISDQLYTSLICSGLNGDLNDFIRIRNIIDKANGIKRYLLVVRWQDVGGQAPPTIELGKQWPPDQTYVIEALKPITRSDVDDVLEKMTTNPTSVMVTPDANATVGWTLLDDFDFASGT